MSNYDSLINLSLEELREAVISSVKSNKENHDMAVLMGSLGVSPKHMAMYNESIKLIKEYEDRVNDRELSR